MVIALKPRTIMERLSRGKTLKRSISIGTRRASIIVSPDAQLKYIKPGDKSFDQDLIRVAQLCLEPEDNVWDLGANVGVFAVSAAVCAQSVVAVEADIWLASIMRRTACLEENSDLDIQIIPVAVSNKNGIAEFQIAARGRASNALAEAFGRTQMGGFREAVYVPTLSLDTLLDELGAPDFVKIDVEGAEWMVVAGGLTLFREHKPMVYIEIGENVRNEVFDFFASNGYKAYDQYGKIVPTSQDLDANVFFACEKHLARLLRLSESSA